MGFFMIVLAVQCKKIDVDDLYPGLSTPIQNIYEYSPEILPYWSLQHSEVEKVSEPIFFV